MSQTKFVALLAGAAVSVGAVSSTMAQTQVDRAADAERLASTVGRSSFQGGTGDTMKVGGLIQFRYTADFRGAGTRVMTTGTNGRFTQGFTNGQTKLWVGGSVGTSDLEYKLQGNFTSDNSGGGAAGPGAGAVPSASAGGTFFLDDAYFNYKLNDSWSVKGGQFKMPLLREETIADQYQLSAQRSFTNNVFSAGRSQQVQLTFAQDNFRAMGGFTDGWRSRNTDFNAPNEADFGLYARAEFKWAGDWSRFDDFTSFKGDGNAGMAGVSLLWQTSGSNGFLGDTVPAPGPAPRIAGSSFFLYSGDVSFEGDGWSLYGAVIGAHLDPRTTLEKTTDSFGLVVQGGYHLNDNWEVFGRWDALFVDKNVGSVAVAGAGLKPHNFHFLTAGVNYYLIPKKHTMKLTVDAVFSFNKTDGLIGTNVLTGANTATNTGLPGGSAAAPYTGGGVLGDVKAGELALQAQVQVLF
ncbi:MAG: porin [Planctomycetota bacterium]